jgi:hypothetical protein
MKTCAVIADFSKVLPLLPVTQILKPLCFEIAMAISHDQDVSNSSLIKPF